ncbi:MAG: response regulator [Vulcanimicrobiaceae bacterium]
MSKILIVDDEPANRLLLLTILEYAGHRVFEAEEGAQGLQIARAVRPDLIVVDLSMPGMGGTGFMKALRADAEIADARVALYTGTSMSAAMAGFMELTKIEHVIPKPSEPQEVLRIVTEALARGSVQT